MSIWELMEIYIQVKRKNEKYRCMAVRQIISFQPQTQMLGTETLQIIEF